MRRSDGQCSKQSDQNDRQVEAAVESILELGEVTMGVLGEIERMVGSGERRLQIAQEDIDRAKLLQLHAGRTAAGDGALVSGSRFCDGSEAPQSIGNDINRRAQRFLRPLGNRVFGKFQLGQANEQRIAGFSGLHRSDEGHLVLRAPAALAAGQLPTQISVVDLNATVERRNEGYSPDTWLNSKASCPSYQKRPVGNGESIERHQMYS